MELGLLIHLQDPARGQHKQVDDDKQKKKAGKKSSESQSGEEGETQKESAGSRSEAGYYEVEDDQKNH